MKYKLILVFICQILLFVGLFPQIVNSQTQAPQAKISSMFDKNFVTKDLFSAEDKPKPSIFESPKEDQIQRKPAELGDLIEQVKRSSNNEPFDSNSRQAIDSNSRVMQVYPKSLNRILDPSQIKETPFNKSNTLKKETTPKAMIKIGLAMPAYPKSYMISKLKELLHAQEVLQAKLGKIYLLRENKDPKSEENLMKDSELIKLLSAKRTSSNIKDPKSLKFNLEFHPWALSLIWLNDYPPQLNQKDGANWLISIEGKDYSREASIKLLSLFDHNLEFINR